jgi:spectinomycin phosphotransferase
MFEKPRLSDAKIITCLQENYGLSVSELTFLPIGYDANAGVYRIRANGQTYFLKVRRGTVDPLSVLLPHYLKDQGIEQIIVPLSTLDHDLWSHIDDFTLILYPFIEGHGGWDREMSDPQWIEFGAVLKQIHTLPIPSELAIPRETFLPPAKYLPLMHQLQTACIPQSSNDPFQQDLAAFWHSQQHEITLIVERTEQLGRMLQNKALDFVLCHADIHVNNLLLTPDGKLFVVDWDQPIIAPKERDLMFTLVGGFVTQEHDEQRFLRGYGPVEIDPLVMAYYRYERLMEDLAEFAAQIFLQESNDETKHEALKRFKFQFGPGGQLPSAHQLDHVL